MTAKNSDLEAVIRSQVNTGKGGNWTYLVRALIALALEAFCMHMACKFR